MKNSRRMKRMSRNRAKVTKMNLTSLMDVFTILLVFLLVNSGSPQLETPKEITLPESAVEKVPRETVVVFISERDIVVQGDAIMTLEDAIAWEGNNIDPLGERLSQLAARAVNTDEEPLEVTVLADRSTPFTIIKRVMSTCTAYGYEQISLAVIQKGGGGARGQQG